MRVIIAGGRNVRLKLSDFRALDALHRQHGFRLVLSGGCSGADADGEAWALRNRISIERHEADWHAYGRSAGPRRNQTMVERADALVVFSGGCGTEDVLKKARRAKLRIFDLSGTRPLDALPSVGYSDARSVGKGG